MSKVAEAIRAREEARKPKPVPKPKGKAKVVEVSETVESAPEETTPEVAE